MLGRVRPSSSSLECLELERPPSKVIKDDSLSIYETTLMKLKRGSRHVETSPEEDSMKTDTSCDSTNTTQSSSDCQSNPMGTPSKEEQWNKTVSVAYLFSKYKSSHHALSSPDEDDEAMTTENGSSSSSSSSSETSLSYSDCQLMNSTRLQLKQGCLGSSPVFLNV